MKKGDLVRHCKNKGVIINVIGEYVEVFLTNQGMYMPETYKMSDLEVINENWTGY